MPTIIVIYADNCKHCEEAIANINEAMTQLKKQCDIKKFLFSTKEAVNIAVNKGIEDLPGLVIGEKVLAGDGITKKDIFNAIKNLK